MMLDQVGVVSVLCFVRIYTTAAILGTHGT